MADIVAKLRAVDHTDVEDCFCQSPLYVQAADEIDALRAKVEAMLEYRRADMREAYEAGYNTRKVGAGLAEGWATYSAKLHKAGGSDDP